MRIDDLLASRHDGTPLYGVQPALSLQGHALAAMQEYRRLVRSKRGNRVWSSSGRYRKVPSNPRELARGYIQAHTHRSAFQDLETRRAAKRQYAVALEVELAALIEIILEKLWNPDRKIRTSALPHMVGLQRMGYLAPTGQGVWGQRVRLGLRKGRRS